MRLAALCLFGAMPCALAAETDPCSIMAVREVVMSETRGGPQPATGDGNGASADDARYQVAIRCGAETLHGIFTTRGGFDVATYRPGTRVTATVEAQKLHLRASDGPSVVGTVITKTQTAR